MRVIARAILLAAVALGTVAAVLGTVALTFELLSERKSVFLMFGGAMVVLTAMGPYVWKAAALALTRGRLAWRSRIAVVMYIIGVVICLGMLLASG